MKVLNDYEARVQAKKEYFNSKSEEAEKQSQDGYAAVRKNGQVIPFGQPILIGHHSEKKHRRFIERQNADFSKASELQKKSEYYAKKAAAVGTGGISSDDEDAILKLKTKLENAEKAQDSMKKANAVIRKFKGDEVAQIEAIVALGLSEAVAKEAVKPDFAGRVGFPPYALTNNNAKIKNMKKRIEELEAKKEMVSVELACDGYTYSEDTAENRVMFIFEGKPDEATRSALKAHAFKWSPSRGAWVRMLNNAGQWAAQQVRKKLDELNA